MSVPALKQKTTPAPQQRPYREFDSYVKAAKRFSDIHGKCLYAERLTPQEFERWDAAFCEFLAGFKCYESEEFYQKTETAKHLLGPNYEIDRQIRRQVVGDKVGFLIGSFPNAGPHNPEIYVAMLIEEIVAANPSVSALEATCRQIRRTATFVPTLAEVLKILREQETFWDGTGLLNCMRGQCAERYLRSELEELTRPGILTATVAMGGRARAALSIIHYRGRREYDEY
jgi:hypothetical protein